MRVAGAASAHGSQQALERSMDLDGRSLDDLDRVRFHNWRAWGRHRYCMSTAETLRMSLALLAIARGRMHSEDQHDYAMRPDRHWQMLPRQPRLRAVDQVGAALHPTAVGLGDQGLCKADEGPGLAVQGRAARVFVNCPLNDDSVRTFQAIVFAIHGLGLQARHALIDDSKVVRLKLIQAESQESLRSIHDVRARRHAATAAFQYVVRGRHRLLDAAAGRPLRHMLLFEKKPCRHNASMSDAPGMDAKIHAGDPALAIEAVRALFANQEWLGEADARGQGHAVFD